MKALLLVLLSATLAFATDIIPGLDEGDLDLDALKREERDVRNSLVKAIQKTNRIELYRLDSTMRRPGGDRFPIYPYSGDTAIVQRITVGEAELPSFVQLWTELFSQPEGSSALCHFPGHGIRFFQGTKLLHESSLCWKCKNYYLPYGGRYWWQGFPTDLAPKLREAIERYLPSAHEASEA